VVLPRMPADTQDLRFGGRNHFHTLSPRKPDFRTGILQGKDRRAANQMCISRTKFRGSLQQRACQSLAPRHHIISEKFSSSSRFRILWSKNSPSGLSARDQRIRFQTSEAHHNRLFGQSLFQSFQPILALGRESPLWNSEIKHLTRQLADSRRHQPTRQLRDALPVKPMFFRKDLAANQMSISVWCKPDMYFIAGITEAGRARPNRPKYGSTRKTRYLARHCNALN